MMPTLEEIAKIIRPNPWKYPWAYVEDKNGYSTTREASKKEALELAAKVLYKVQQG